MPVRGHRRPRTKDGVREMNRVCEICQAPDGEGDLIWVADHYFSGEIEGVSGFFLRWKENGGVVQDAVLFWGVVDSGRIYAFIERGKWGL
jgi:hypothetical protein